jgi:hypothetical protein
MGKESGGMRALMRDYGCSVGFWFFSSFVIFVSTAKEFFLKIFLSEDRGCEVTTKKKHCKEVSENIC